MSSTETIRIKAAMAEAERFIAKAAEFLEAGVQTWEQSKHRAAVRRSSMDLTRALADVRRRED